MFVAKSVWHSLTFNCLILQTLIIFGMGFFYFLEGKELTYIPEPERKDRIAFWKQCSCFSAVISNISFSFYVFTYIVCILSKYMKQLELIRL